MHRLESASDFASLSPHPASAADLRSYFPFLSFFRCLMFSSKSCAHLTSSSSKAFAAVVSPLVLVAGDSRKANQDDKAIRPTQSDRQARVKPLPFDCFPVPAPAAAADMSMAMAVKSLFLE